MAQQAKRHRLDTQRRVDRNPLSAREQDKIADEHAVRPPSGSASVAPAIDPAAASELSRAFIPPVKFGLVLSAFGDLPEAAQCEFASQLIRASEIYRLRKSIERQRFPIPSADRQQLKLIRDCAARLLKLLGLPDHESIALGDLASAKLHSVTTTSIVTGLYRVALERRPQIEVDAWERLRDLLVLLSDLVETAAREHAKPEINKTKGKSAAGELIYTFIDIYADFRKGFPASGPQPRFDARLRLFVRSCLEFSVSTIVWQGSDGKPYQRADQRVIDTKLASESRTTDAVIRGQWNQWDRVHKSK